MLPNFRITKVTKLRKTPCFMFVIICFASLIIGIWSPMGIALLIGCIITLLIAIVRKSALPFIYFLMAILLLLPKFRDVIGLATTRVDEFLVFPLLGLVLLAFSRQRKQNFTN